MKYPKTISRTQNPKPQESGPVLEQQRDHAAAGAEASYAGVTALPGLVDFEADLVGGLGLNYKAHRSC